MQEKNIILEALNIDTLVFFLGSEAEQEEAEAKEAARLDEVKKIIFAPDFCALAYYSGKLYKVFTRSTHPGAFWALSVFYNGEALSHTEYDENGNTSGSPSIFREIMCETIESPLTLDILTT